MSRLIVKNLPKSVSFLCHVVYDILLVLLLYILWALYEYVNIILRLMIYICSHLANVIYRQMTIINIDNYK